MADAAAALFQVERKDRVDLTAGVSARFEATGTEVRVVLRNEGDRHLRFSEGGAYRGGRNENFDFHVFDGDRKLERIERMAMGGPYSSQTFGLGHEGWEIVFEGDVFVTTPDVPADCDVIASGYGLTEEVHVCSHGGTRYATERSHRVFDGRHGTEPTILEVPLNDAGQLVIESASVIAGSRCVQTRRVHNRGRETRESPELHCIGEGTDTPVVVPGRDFALADGPEGPVLCYKWAGDGIAAVSIVGGQRVDHKVAPAICAEVVSPP